MVFRYLEGNCSNYMTNIKNDFFGENPDNYYLQVIESLPLGILVFSAEGRITFLNNNFLEFCAFHNLEINPSNTLNLFKEDLFPGNNLTEYFKRLLEGNSFETAIERVRTFTLRQLIIQIKVMPLFKDDKFNGGILIIHDIKIGSEKESSSDNLDQRWQEILNSAVDLLLITDEVGNIKFSFGKKSKKFLSRVSPFEQNNVDSLFSEEINTTLKNKIKSLKENAISQKLNLALIINNRPHDYECEIEPILDDDKKIKLLFFRFTDIRSFVKIQRELEQKIADLARNESYLANTTHPIFTINLSGKIIFWNKASQELFGYSEFQAAGKYFVPILGITASQYFEDIKQQLNKTKQVNSTINIISSSGQEETLSASYNLVEISEPYIVVSCQIISDRITLENKLKIVETNFNSIVQHSGNIIFTTDSEGKFLQSNEAFLNCISINQNDLYSLNLKNLLEAEYISKTTLAKISSEAKATAQIELPIVLKDKRKIYLKGVLQSTLNLAGEKIYIGSFQDITSIKINSHELRIFSDVIRSAKIGIAIEKDNKIILANESFAKFLGYGRSEEFVGKSFIEFTADDDVKRISEYIHLIRRKMDAPSTFEFLGKKEDGSTTFYSASVSEFEAEEKGFIVYMIRDISERKRSQQALRESEEKYRSLIENIDDYFYTFSKIGNKFKPIFYSSSVQKITGYTQEEYIKDQRLFLKVILPDDIRLIKQKIKELFKSRIKKAGEIEYRIVNKYGNVVWVRNRISLIKDEHGEIKSLYGIVSDITIRKIAEQELQKSKEDLVRLNETKDRFLSIVSHDLRTPFSSILGFTDLLLNDESLSESERKQYVQFIQESSHSMLGLVNSLLDWNRLQTGRIEFEPEKTYAHPLIERSINALSAAALKKNIKMKSSIGEMVQIFVDENLIIQVFNNLISNAIKFSNKGGTISISVSPSQKLRFLEFAVQDSGVGIKPEDIKKLFSIESKFSLEGTSGEKGSGLGLSIVNDIIQKHGGSIWVNSEPGIGSTFKFTLPIASAVILLVDDSKTDRFLYSKILKNITPDYSVEIASNGKEALDKIIKSPPALVITDHNMPEMNGIQLVEEIQNLESKLKPPVIILSGKIERQTIHDYNLLGIDYIFQKPVNLANFKQAVEKTIRKGLLGE